MKNLTLSEAQPILDSIKLVSFEPGANYGLSFDKVEPEFENINSIPVEVKDMKGVLLGSTRLPLGEVECYEGLPQLARLVMDENQLTKLGLNPNSYVAVSAI